MLIVILLFVMICFIIGFNIYFYLMNSYYLKPESNDMIIYYKFGLNDILNNKVANYAFKNSVYDLVLVNNPIIDNSSFIKGKSSLYFNGNKQYASIDPIKFSQNGLTIMGWFKFVSNDPYNFIFSFSYDANNNLNITSNMLAIAQGTNINDVNNRFYNFKQNYSDNNWHHVTLTMTYSPFKIATSTANVYIDNKLEISILDSFYPNTSLIFKKNYINNTIVLHNYITKICNINDFRMYNKVLTQSEITSIYIE